jgi:hypothetical protein
MNSRTILASICAFLGSTNIGGYQEIIDGSRPLSLAKGLDAVHSLTHDPSLTKSHRTLPFFHRRFLALSSPTQLSHCKSSANISPVDGSGRLYPRQGISSTS